MNKETSLLDKLSKEKKKEENCYSFQIEEVREEESFILAKMIK